MLIRILLVLTLAFNATGLYASTDPVDSLNLRRCFDHWDAVARDNNKQMAERLWGASLYVSMVASLSEEPHSRAPTEADKDLFRYILDFTQQAIEYDIIGKSWLSYLSTLQECTKFHLDGSPTTVQDFYLTQSIVIQCYTESGNVPDFIVDYATTYYDALIRAPFLKQDSATDPKLQATQNLISHFTWLNFLWPKQIEDINNCPLEGTLGDDIRAAAETLRVGYADSPTISSQARLGLIETLAPYMGTPDILRRNLIYIIGQKKLANNVEIEDCINAFNTPEFAYSPEFHARCFEALKSKDKPHHQALQLRTLMLEHVRQSTLPDTEKYNFYKMCAIHSKLVLDQLEWASFHAHTTDEHELVTSSINVATALLLEVYLDFVAQGKFDDISQDVIIRHILKGPNFHMVRKIELLGSYLQAFVEPCSEEFLLTVSDLLQDHMAGRVTMAAYPVLREICLAFAPQAISKARRKLVFARLDSIPLTAFNCNAIILEHVFPDSKVRMSKSKFEKIVTPLLTDSRNDNLSLVHRLSTTLAAMVLSKQTGHKLALDPFETFPWDDIKIIQDSKEPKMEEVFVQINLLCDAIMTCQQTTGEFSPEAEQQIKAALGINEATIDKMTVLSRKRKTKPTVTEVAREESAAEARARENRANQMIAAEDRQKKRNAEKSAKAKAAALERQKLEDAKIIAEKQRKAEEEERELQEAKAARAAEEKRFAEMEARQAAQRMTDEAVRIADLQERRKAEEAARLAQEQAEEAARLEAARLEAEQQAQQEALLLAEQRRVVVQVVPAAAAALPMPMPMPMPPAVPLPPINEQQMSLARQAMGDSLFLMGNAAYLANDIGSAITNFESCLRYDGWINRLLPVFTIILQLVNSGQDITPHSQIIKAMCYSKSGIPILKPTIDHILEAVNKL